jgi:hypothetical protein
MRLVAGARRQWHPWLGMKALEMFVSRTGLSVFWSPAPSGRGSVGRA